MTNMRENIAVAITAIMSNKLRSMLTMLGIIIGISAVITIVSIGSGQAKRSQDALNNQGLANINITVRRKEGSQSNEETAIVLNKDLIRDVYERYSGQCEGVAFYKNIDSIETEWQSDYTKTKKASVITYFSFVNASLMASKKHTYIAGSPITDAEYRNGARVIILTDSQAKILFGTSDESCIGQKVETYFNNIYSDFTVKGIIKQKEDFDFFNYYVDPLTDEYKTSALSFIPLRTYENLTGQQLTFDSCVFIPRSGATSDEVLALVDNIKADLNEGADESVEYNVFSSIDYIKEQGETVRMQFLVTALVAAIALIVGGIGVMNIMMVSITERTREIGTRKALGATNSSLLLQFITEAILLCLMGGLIGIVLGIIFGIVACHFMKLPYVLEPLSIVLSVVFSLLTGTFFGYYPASRAAKMDPIEALRYE